jgi:hypothetical protein
VSRFRDVAMDGMIEVTEGERTFRKLPLRRVAFVR